MIGRGVSCWLILIENEVRPGKQACIFWQGHLVKILMIGRGVYCCLLILIENEVRPGKQACIFFAGSFDKNLDNWVGGLLSVDID